jgi:hypothetical protein
MLSLSDYPPKHHHSFRLNQLSFLKDSAGCDGKPLKIEL